MNRNILTATIAASLLTLASSVLAQTAPPPVPPVPATPLSPLPIIISDGDLATTDNPTAVENTALAAAKAGLDEAAKGMQTIAYFSSAELPKTPISLKVRDSKVTDALKNALDQAKLACVLDDDIPDEPKVTIDVQNVHIDAVLNLLTENAGVSWSAESKGGKTTVHVGKKVRRATAFRNFADFDGGLQKILMTTNSLNNPYVLSVRSHETRSTFTCSNCHNQITIVRKNIEAKCPTCGRTFEADWKVCPFDGTARPVAQDTWKFCPICAFPIPPAAAAPVTKDTAVTSVTVTTKDVPPPATAKP